MNETLPAIEDAAPAAPAPAAPAPAAQAPAAQAPAAQAPAQGSAQGSAQEPAAEPVRPAAARIGVLLVNLGTPDAADAAAVRKYLEEFLTDPRVIENQGFVWKFVLNNIILRFRPRRKARDYAKIWNKEKNESPLKTITRSQAEKLANTLSLVGGHIVVDWAMRYGNPSIASRLGELAAQGCERILVVPLYPQYCAATTATVGDEVFRALAGMRFQPALRIAPPYYNDPGYIEALASSTSAALAGIGFEPDVILASFHGVPKAYVDKGDPYYTHCIETMRLLRERLKLDEAKLQLTFQSRFGRAKWLEPATDQTVKKLAKSGVKNLAVITPGFSADCLETLEEIAVENAHIFKKHGGQNFAAIPCLNDGTPGMQVISQLALRELKGWV
jgi:protoporphyrin/coproporphyrin ferrochelatase